MKNSVFVLGLTVLVLSVALVIFILALTQTEKRQFPGGLL